MRVGITGSSGFIGSALVAALHERGDEVVRFVRPGAQFQDSVIRWDPVRGLVDDDDLRRAGSLDAVVHLAGAGIADKRWNDARKQEILLSRTQSTSLLVRALSSMTSPPGKLASGSAIGIYGSRGDELLDEHSSHGDDFLAGVCEQWEAAASDYGRHGSSVALLRTGIVMGLKGGALKKQLPLFRAGLGGRLSDGRQWISPISLRDHVRATLFVLDNALVGPVNLVAPSPLTNRDFTHVLASQLHRPSVASVPAFALRLVLGSELVSGAILASQRVVPLVLSGRGFEFNDATFEDIARSLAN
jgi:hypothetical protein